MFLHIRFHHSHQISKALENIKATLSRYESQGCLRGSLSASEQAALVTGCNELKKCLDGASYVQVYGLLKMIRFNI